MAEKKNAKATEPGKEKPLTQMEAMRRALADLGKDAQPLTLQNHLKEKFGMDLSTHRISNYKSDIRKKEKEKRRAARKAAQAPAPAASAAPKAEARPVSAGKATADVISDIETVQALAARLGANNLKRLIDLVTR